jgi:hypothetical protein
MAIGVGGAVSGSPRSLWRPTALGGKRTTGTRIAKLTVVGDYFKIASGPSSQRLIAPNPPAAG